MLAKVNLKKGTVNTSIGHPNLNYGLFTRILCPIKKKCKYDLNLSKWILSKEKSSKF